MNFAGFAVLIIVAGTSLAKDSPPRWPTNYTVNGLLQLPYAELKEPFTAFFDGTNNRSKITYYDDMMITLQFGSDGGSNFGKNFKVAHITTETETNKKACFLVNGTKDAMVETQSVLPDLTNFTLVSNFTWQFVQKIGNKKNTYTMTLKQMDSNGGLMPVRYEMFGYDTLLGSHYDKYYIDYDNFMPEAKDESFVLPKNLDCTDFPGPGDMEHTVTMNPMQEYIHGRDEHVDEMFNKFKKTHGKQYKDPSDHQSRMHTFRHNVRYIHSKNRAALGYSLAVNHLADFSSFELRKMRGYLNSKQSNNAEEFNMNDITLRYLPDSMDWRLYGAVTPVKDQAVCGSCWSFGTTGTIEGTYFLKTGELVRLSQQELMDCSWGEGNNACDGGEDFRAYEWILKHGLSTTDAYGDYLAVDGMCNAANTTSMVHMTGYKNVTSGDTQALRLAIAQNGPISVAIDASHMSFVFYSNGVYYEPECGSTPDDLDHAVLAVGYGTMNGKGYWLVKNSWSTYWGNDGYVLMAQKDNNCGVATDATFVKM